VDFADVRTVMNNMGRALMGSGYSAGDRKALEAAQQAISSPLLEDASIEGATGILINITGGPDLTLSEIHEAASLIQGAAHEDANIIFGSVIDANMEDQVRITVIATGFDRQETKPALGRAIAAAVRPVVHRAHAEAPALERQHQQSQSPALAAQLEPAYAPTPTTIAASAAHDGALCAPAASPSRLEPAPAIQPAPAAPVHHPHAAPGLQQTAFPYGGAETKEDPGRRGSRRTTGSQPVVPRIHPTLGTPEEEMDIPAFIRKHQPISSD